MEGLSGLSTISGFSIFVLAVVVLAIVLIASGVKSIPQGMEYTVERFGRYTRTLACISSSRSSTASAPR